MKPKKTLREQREDNFKAEQLWATSFGKPLREGITPIKPKRERGPAQIKADAGAKEAEVLSAVLALLRIHPKVGWVRRMNVGASENANGQYVAFGFKGCSDIIGQMKDGKFLAIECKREKGGIASEAQLKFINTVRTYGGVAGIVRSVDEAQKILEGI